MRRYTFIILIITLAGTTYFTDFFLKKERSLSENLALKQGNQELLAQLQRYAVLRPEESFEKESGFLKARVYSNYPFNVKNQITIDAGRAEGVKVLAPVVLEKNILVGQVKEVAKNTSIIQTIFDPGMQFSVRIGAYEINGLFQGGSEPKVALIEKTKPITIGDVVYSASPSFPYGLKIGEVSEIKENIPGVFKEASLKIPFSISELREVNIILN